MKNEVKIRADQVQGGDLIRFEKQRKYRKVMSALPSAGRTLIIIPGHDNYLRDNSFEVFKKQD